MKLAAALIREINKNLVRILKNYPAFFQRTKSRKEKLENVMFRVINAVQ